MKSWKKRALALTTGGFGRARRLHVPVQGAGKRRRRRTGRHNVDVSDAYFGLGVVSFGHSVLNPVMDGTEVNSMLREALYEGLFEIKNDFTLENELCEDVYAAMKLRSALR